MTTGTTGELANHIHCCIEIEQCTQSQTNSGIWRVSPCDDDDDFEDPEKEFKASIQGQSIDFELQDLWRLMLMLEWR